MVFLSNLFQTDDATGKLTSQRGIETCLHEELTTEGLALKVMTALCALKLVEAIGGVGVEAGHVPAGRLQSNIVLELIGESQGQVA